MFLAFNTVNQVSKSSFLKFHLIEEIVVIDLKQGSLDQLYELSELA